MIGGISSIHIHCGFKRFRSLRLPHPFTTQFTTILFAQSVDIAKHVEEITMQIWLRKGRNKLTGLGGAKEKGALQKIKTALPSKTKARPNTAGVKPLKQPQLQQTAGAKKLTSGGKKGFRSASLKMGHLDFLPNYFTRGMLVEFKAADGSSGLGTVRDRGPKGLQLLTDTGQIRNVFTNEIKGKFRPTQAKAR